MRELIDCHIHTERCGHATGSAEEYVAAAAAKGLSAIVMADHLPLPDDLDPDHHLSMRLDEVDSYLAEVAAARAAHPDVEVITAVEADYLPDRLGWTRELLRDVRRRPDGPTVVLGSVHFLGDWPFDDPARLADWDERDVGAVYNEYFEIWCDAARSGLFDVMTHPDLVKKFGHRPKFKMKKLYAKAAQAAAEAEVVIEVSTAGLRKPVGEMYPSLELLTAFREAGVEATVGSDAHAPEEVGYEIEAAYELLRKAGYLVVTLPMSRREQRIYGL
ncbi:MAG: histidinol-phosphatase HisJ family protein [Coriobacteriales bacterium]|nr:histidinol-phosphatase HisJ family protein [Coriobacteriales bacterium]